MHLAGILATLLFLAACNQLSAPSTTTGSAAPVATPTTASDLPVRDLSFTCRLPFARDLGVGHWQAGFLDLPSRAFRADPTAPAQPGYYDRQVSRWLPVGRQATAPDGLHYAYMTGGNPSNSPGPPRLHIVAAASGAERVLDLRLSDQLPYGVEDYAADGVYIASGWEGALFGRWRVDPATGIVIDVSKQDHFLNDGTGHAWVSVFDARDPNPARSALSGDPLPNEVVRRDLRTGAVETWFYHPGNSVAVADGFVDGGLVVWVEPNAGLHEYWLVPAPGTARLVAYLDGGGASMADIHGIWLGGDGLYLFTHAGGVTRVSDLPGEPGNGCLAS
jgi:hypothetical protein